MDALDKLLADKSFGPPSAAAVTARKTGECLHQWLAAAEHQEKAKAFSDSLLASLDTCFDPRLNARVQKETMWGKFHQLRCSQPFVCMWRTFLMETLSVDACPIFFQYLTDAFFRGMIWLQFPLKAEEQQSTSSCKHTLTYCEKNALRYAAGYVIRHLQTKIKRSAHQLKDELLFCLTELKETENQEEESEDWIKSIDRGGLTHVSNMTYMVFEAMELELRTHFVIIDMARESQLKARAKIEIENNEDVCFYWCMVCAEWEEKTSQTLLSMIIDEWITIRGFSAVSGWLELYKQAHKKIVQKSKGVRKQLCN